MKRSLTRFTLCLLGFGMTCLLYGCTKPPVEQCGVEGLDYFAECTEQQGYKEDVPDDPNNATQKEKQAIIFGDSIALGGDCQRTCGFKNQLDQEIGLRVAGYGIANYAARWEVEGGIVYPYCGIGNEVTGEYPYCTNPAPEIPQLWRSSQSMDNNPGAERVYVHIGGNDLLHCYLQKYSAPPECSEMVWPTPATGCSVSVELNGFMDQIVTYVGAIVENYQQGNLDENAEIYVLATGHFVEACWVFLAAGDSQECINEMFDLLSDKLEFMAGNKGVHFVDLTLDSRLKDYHCTDDCLHYDCRAFPLIVENILDPVF